jgi:phosphohistidine swiveling domain-containing protein
VLAVGLRVAWAIDATNGQLITHSLSAMTSHTADGFERHEELLAADETARYDVVMLRANDPLNAERVRDELRERSPRLAVALCSGCECAAGIAVAHGIDPAAFDRFIPKPFEMDEVIEWLDGLELGGGDQTLASGRIRGIAAAPGVVEGVARIVLGEDQFDQVIAGDILVCIQVDNPAWMVLFSRIVGVVTDLRFDPETRIKARAARAGLPTGGFENPTCAIVSREFGIPCVIGTTAATGLIRSGDRIRVNGSTGLVEILERAAPPE